MSVYTDKDIPISCSECPGNHVEEGLDAMIAHIIENHKNYSQMEANEYAMRWMDDSYDRMAQQLKNYYEDRKNEDRDD